MLEPNKYTNVPLSVLGLSATILSCLKNERAQKYNQLLGSVVGKRGGKAKTNFKFALIFLFSIGKIKYAQKEDVLQLI